MSRLVPALVVLPVAAALAACGGSHKPASTSTGQTPTSTVPPRILSLVAANFPSRLTGSLTFSIDRKHGDPAKPGGWKRRYAVRLDHVVLRLTGTSGQGAKRSARYELTEADASFRGFEDLTDSKCRTTHTVWHGLTGKAVRGALAIYGAKFSSGAGYEFLVPQRGETTTRRCGSTGPGTHGSVTRTARIVGDGSLELTQTTAPEQRFAVLIEVQTSAGGALDSGGYRIDGSLRPPADGRVPVKVCTEKGARLACPAA